MKVKFAKERTTKNTVVYGEMPELGDPVVIGSLYVQKRAMNSIEGVAPGSEPEIIYVEITAG